MHHRRIHDTVLLSGWLFADLLLGLMMIFLATLPGEQPKPIIVPTLTVRPASLDPTNPNCTGGTSAPQCIVILGETSASVGPMAWMASSDMSDSVIFSASTNTLTPGASVKVTISALPCQNGSLTFSGSRGARPFTVRWKCKAPVVRLDLHFKEFKITVDPQGMLNNSQSATNSVKSQVRSQSFLQGRSVGLAIVYDGAPTDNDVGVSLAIANKVYKILGQLGQEGFAFQNASYYNPLFSLGDTQTDVSIDVYLFIQE